MSQPADFRGTERFSIVRRLGSGAMGVVYEVFDRGRGQRVALKTLHAVDAGALYHLKQEFRALADVTHPNLVTLHELVSAGDEWFVTMEYVAGVGFLEWVRAGVAPEAAPSPAAQTWTEGRPQRATDRLPVHRPRGAPVHLGRLREAAAQLAAGMAALHAAGKVHRDIKPGNVLVTPEGRVVLLDFGLVRELGEPDLMQSADERFVGTPAYMAPEQVRSQAVGPAADWYAFGVILFEALTGRLPFLGAAMDVLLDKQQVEPPPPRELAAGVPDDLNALTVALLRARPEDRPGGREVLRRLGNAPGERDVAETKPPSSSAEQQRFVGRERPLAELDAAFQSAQEGRAVIVYVHGRSGMGKSALVRRFLEELVHDRDAVVLQGRCYERESVPYKAVDSLVDALARHLGRLSRQEADAVVPMHVQALARLFPVLRRVEAFAEAPRRVADAPDPIELRRRAFAALRELLSRLAARRALVLAIDDLQWGDLDSAALLAEVLRPPDAPPLLLIASYRSEEADSPALESLREGLAAVAADAREIALAALSEDEAYALAGSLLGRTDPEGAALTFRIAAESNGNPYLLGELLRAAQEGTVALGSEGFTLDAVLHGRVARLPEDARRLLEVVAVAGRPIAQELAARAARLAEPRAALTALRGGNLVRARGGRNRDEIEAYHDRVRASVVLHLGEDALAGVHLRLGLALESSPDADAETLALHFLAGGDRERAGRYAVKAAGAAREALAFDRAAKLYRQAIELEPVGVDVRGLRALLGDALANAGRGAEAAKAYLEAIPGAGSAETLDLQRRAAEQLLRSGRLEEGMAVLRDVLRAAGMSLPATPRGALFSLLWRRAFIYLRGLGFRRRDPSEIAPRDLTRIDIAFSVAALLSIVDTIRSSDYTARHLLLALPAGEPYRVARAFALEIGHLGTAGSRGWKRTQAVIALGDAWGKQTNVPHAMGLIDVAFCIATHLVGDFAGCVARGRGAERRFRDECSGVAWELDTLHIFMLGSLFYLGELGEISRRVPEFAKEARERGNLYGGTNLHLGLSNSLHLAADDPAAARRAADQAIAGWPRSGFHVQHYWHLIASLQADLYAGEPEAALARIAEAWRPLRRSLLLRVQQLRVEITFARGRAALASGDPRAALADAARMERARCAWGAALATLLRAGAARSAGDLDRARALYASGASACAAEGMRLFAAAARRAEGELVGGDEGKALVVAADAVMSAEEVRSPARMAAMLLGTPPR